MASGLGGAERTDFQCSGHIETLGFVHFCAILHAKVCKKSAKYKKKMQANYIYTSDYFATFCTFPNFITHQIII